MRVEDPLDDDLFRKTHDYNRPTWKKARQLREFGHEARMLEKLGLTFRNEILRCLHVDE